MKIATKDPSKGHFWVSMFKSGLRIGAGVWLVLGDVFMCGVLLILAEVLGIVEEIV
jgi:hypothetical protein